MTVGEAIKRLKAKYPKLHVIDGCDYDKDHYMFTAVEDPNKVDYNDPYYAVNKKSGLIYSVDPTADLAKFSRAYYERNLNLGGEL